MHETSLGFAIRDYLTGEEIESTTYEDLRQALARLLVEELGYPATSLRPKVQICYPVGDKHFTRVVDLAAYGPEVAPDAAPLLVLVFCPGKVDTYLRESVAAARLLAAPLVVVTDSMDARLLASADETVLGSGMRAIPLRADLEALAAAHRVRPLTPDQAENERRILFMYSELSSGGCCGRCSLV